MVNGGVVSINMALLTELEYLMREEFGDGFGAGTDVEFFINPADVVTHGVDADV